MPNTPEGDRLTDAIGGDPSAFAALARQHAGPLIRFLSRIDGNPHRAEDIAQDALLAAWRHRGQFDAARRFKPWLFRIALNRLRELHRKRPAPVHLPDGAGPPTPATDAPVAAAVAVETSSLVLQAIDRLPNAQRAVVMLRVWEELSYAEIGFALSIHEGTARSHMHHALAALRVSLRHLE